MKIRNLLGELGQSRRRHRTNPKILRGLVWLDHALYLSGLGLSDFARKFLDHHSEKSGLVYKWASGATMPNPTSVRRIDKKLPGSAAFYDLPLYAFLDTRPLTKKQTKKLLAVYEIPGRELNPWAFPNDQELDEQRRFIQTMIRDDSHALFSRGDIYGFTVIVGLVREAEAAGDTRSLLIHLTNMYRAFPSVARIPWFRNHINLLRECVDAIYYRNLVVRMAFDVDWAVIKKQINAPIHETIRHLCPRDPVTQRYILPVDPIVFREPALGDEGGQFDPIQCK